MRVWHRYLFKQAIANFLVILGMITLLYLIVDISTHAKDLDVARYGKELASLASIMLPLALLLTTIKVIATLMMRGEILALLCSGLSPRKLLFPFLGIAFLCMAFLLALPLPEASGPILLEDGSTLLAKEEGFWIKSADEFYFGAKHFVRNEAGQIVMHHEEVAPQLPKPIRFSWKKEHFGMHKMNDQEALVTTTRFFAYASPLCCLLCVLLPLSFLLRCTRARSLFLLVAISLFGLISFFIVNDSLRLLCAAQIFPPFLSVALFYGVALLVCARCYAKL